MTSQTFEDQPSSSFYYSGLYVVVTMPENASNKSRLDEKKILNDS